MIEGLMHIGVYTKDMNQSIDFYTSILGFNLRWRGDVPVKAGVVEAAVVEIGNCIIELVKPIEDISVHNTEGPVQHICLKVTEIDQVIDSLIEQGIRIDEDPTDIIFEGGIRHAFIRGPSNERIELGEYLSTRN